MQYQFRGLPQSAVFVTQAPMFPAGGHGPARWAQASSWGAYGRQLPLPRGMYTQHASLRSQVAAKNAAKARARAVAKAALHKSSGYAGACGVPGACGGFAVPRAPRWWQQSDSACCSSCASGGPCDGCDGNCGDSCTCK